MGFIDAVRTCLGKYATFRGRARRSEFWWFALFVTLVQFGVSVIDLAAFGAGPDGLGAFGFLLNLAMLLPNLAVSVRRLHDIGRSGWWYLIIFVPLVGILALLWWWTRPSEPDANRFGPPPDGGEPQAGSGVPRVPRRAR